MCLFFYVSVSTCVCLRVCQYVCVCDSMRAYTRLCLAVSNCVCNTLKRTATPCNTLQHTATHCNTLQHTATHCNTFVYKAVSDCVQLQGLFGGYIGAFMRICRALFWIYRTLLRIYRVHKVSMSNCVSVSVCVCACLTAPVCVCLSVWISQTNWQEQGGSRVWEYVSLFVYIGLLWEVGSWGRVPFSRNLMSPTPRRKWYLTTGRRAH